MHIEKLIEEKEFKEEIAIIRFIIANMDKLVKGEMIPIADVTEEPNKHPHYHSRVVTDLSYDEEKGFLVYTESRSGSPSCWNWYSNDYRMNIFELARYIANDINAAKCINIEDDVKVEYMEIEGM